jgi:hypothetical protein
MRSRTTLDFGLGVLHLDVLRARLRRRRSPIRALLLVGVLSIATALAWPYVTAQLLGQGTLILLDVPPDADLALDGQPLSSPQSLVLSGAHTLTEQRPGFYGVVLPLTITREQTTKLRLPSLRPRPTVQPVPLPGVGTSWQAATPDGTGGWRLAATAANLRPTPAPYTARAQDLAPRTTLLHLDAVGLTHLAVLEAYVAADERTTAAGTSWAAYESSAAGHAGWLESAGRLTIRWPGGSSVLTPTMPVSGLWWAPNGRQLLVAVQRGGGQDLAIWTVDAPNLPAPIVTVPGQIMAVQWHPTGRAAVVLSTNQAAPDTPAAPVWDATLLLPAPGSGESTRALRLAAPPPAALGLVPLAWEADALLWVTARGAAWELQRIPFSAALPTRLGAVPTGTLALHLNGDGALRLLVQEGGVLTLRDGASGATLLTLDDLPPTPGLSAAWQDKTLLLGTEQELWELTFSSATLE